MGVKFEKDQASILDIMYFGICQIKDRNEELNGIKAKAGVLTLALTFSAATGLGLREIPHWMADTIENQSASLDACAPREGLSPKEAAGVLRLYGDIGGGAGFLALGLSAFGATRRILRDKSPAPSNH